MRFILIITLFSILVCSCSNQDKRIELLQGELNIKLPQEYEIVEDKDISQDDFTGDYTLIVRLRINNIDSVVKQIKLTPYFDELERFKTGRKIGDDIQYFDMVQDSISKSKYRGSWFMVEKGYEFIDLSESLKSRIHANIDEQEKILEFVYIGM